MMVLFWPGFADLVGTSFSMTPQNIAQIVVMCLALIASAKDVTIGLVVLMILSAGSMVAYYYLEWSLLLPTLLLFTSFIGMALSLFIAYKTGGGLI